MNLDDGSMFSIFTHYSVFNWQFPKSLWQLLTVYHNWSGSRASLVMMMIFSQSFIPPSLPKMVQYVIVVMHLFVKLT